MIADHTLQDSLVDNMESMGLDENGETSEKNPPFLRVLSPPPDLQTSSNDDDMDDSDDSNDNDEEYCDPADDDVVVHDDVENNGEQQMLWSDVASMGVSFPAFFFGNSTSPLLTSVLKG
jgi:hypothetical protein